MCHGKKKAGKCWPRGGRNLTFWQTADRCENRTKQIYPVPHHLSSKDLMEVNITLAPMTTPWQRYIGIKYIKYAFAPKTSGHWYKIQMQNSGRINLLMYHLTKKPQNADLPGQPAGLVSLQGCQHPLKRRVDEIKQAVSVDIATPYETPVLFRMQMGQPSYRVFGGWMPMKRFLITGLGSQSLKLGWAQSQETKAILEEKIRQTASNFGPWSQAVYKNQCWSLRSLTL